MAWEYLYSLNNYQFSAAQAQYIEEFLSHYPDYYYYTTPSPHPAVQTLFPIISQYARSFHPDPITPPLDTIETITEYRNHKLAIKKTGVWNVQVLFYENGSLLDTAGAASGPFEAGTHPATEPYLISDVGFVVNHELQQASVLMIGYRSDTGGLMMQVPPNYCNSRAWYDHLMALMSPVYNWSAWNQINGNNSQYRCSLTKLKASAIGDFSTYQLTNSDSFNLITAQSSVWNYFQNAEYDTENIIAWSGVNWLTLTCSEVSGQPNEVKFTFKFYIKSVSEVTPVYTYEEVLLYQGTTPARNYYLSFIRDDTNQVAVFLPIKYTPIVTGIEYGYGNTSPSENEMLYIWLWLQASNAGEPVYPYDTGTTDNGGQPTTDVLPNDLMPTVTAPTLSASTSGLFTIYCPTDTDLANIATFLWSDSVIDNFKKYFNNFSDNIIALYVLPYKPSNLPTKAFKVGRVVSDTITSVEYVTTRFVTIDMGEVVIGGCWDSYLDFSPYTKFNIYLPGIGVQAIDADDILAPLDRNKNFGEMLGSTISLQYNLDLMTGIVVAYVKINGQIRYQFSGKIGYSIPLTGETHRTLLQGFAMATAGAIGTIASGGTAAPFAAAAASAAIINAMKPDVYRGSNLSGDAASLCYETPYLIRRVPNKPQLVNQDRFTGFQSYKTGLLSEFSGYTEVEEVHAEGFVCTEEEREEIIELLKKGVIL